MFMNNSCACGCLTGSQVSAVVLESHRAKRNIRMKRSLILMSALAMVAFSMPAMADGNGYHEWARSHQDWVRLHPDRARYFEHHPDMAEKLRHEWSDWSAEHPQFNDWAETHPGWVVQHKERAEVFRGHPEEAVKYQKEWQGHRETPAEYKHWVHEREGH
jgi:hypothetical protein